MVICKFFQEGRCKYGINCRFEHSSFDHRKENYRQNSNQGFHQHQKYVQPQSYFPQQHVYNAQQSGFPAQGSQPNNVNANQTFKDSIKMVVEDAIMWERGNQWLFSCYAPLLRKLIPNMVNANSENLPGFTDYSPEELRLEAMSSHQAGQFNQYTSNLHQLAQKYAANRAVLQKPDQQTVEFILRYERGENVAPVGFASSTSFGSSIPTPVQQAPPPASSFSFKLPPGSNPPPSQPPAKPFTFSIPINHAVKANETPAAGVFTTPAVPMFQAPAQTATTGTQLPVTQSTNADVYSALAQMSSSNLESYKMEKFTLGKIPRHPPPQELCF